MKTDTHYWSYLAYFFLEWEMFHTKVVEKIKTHFVFSDIFFRTPCHIWDTVEQYYRAGQATDDITRHMRNAFWIPKATNTESEHVILIAFPQQPWLHERASLLRYSTLALLLLGRWIMTLVISSEAPTATTDNIHSKSSLHLYSCIRNYCELVQKMWVRADRQTS